MEYVYLDWNVIQNMEKSTVKDSIDGVAFAELVRKLSNKYKFPFSEGHLKDLAISDRPDYIKKHLNYLNELSNGYVLGIDAKENLVITNEVYIFNFFNEIATEININPSFEISGESYPVDMKKLTENDLLRPLLESNNGVLDVTVMEKFLLNLWESMNNPEFYKLFRIQVSELKNRFDGTDTILNQDSCYFKGLVPFLDFLITDDLQVLEDNFNNAMKAFSSIDGRNFDKLKQGERIQQAYILLDFHPKFRDKLKKKNKPSNIYRDCKHLFFASQAKYYVTADNATFKKASFVCKALSLRVKVLSMSEFIHKFC